jgi:glyoxylase-like metal-dependent hydrolase (beta-lactamase superfamily II)
LFSGDTLFVKGVGTTAYGGNDEELRESIEFLFSLDKKIILWPGHNYGGEFAELGTALKNSHLKPNARIHEKIRQMVLEYESKQGNKKF